MNLKQIERALIKYASRPQEELLHEYVQRRLDKSLLRYIDDIDRLQRTILVGATSREYFREIDK